MAVHAKKHLSTGVFDEPILDMSVNHLSVHRGVSVCVLNADNFMYYHYLLGTN